MTDEETLEYSKKQNEIIISIAKDEEQEEILICSSKDRSDYRCTGYNLAREIYMNIAHEENHEISIEDMIRVISFWGFNEESAKNSTIGFVCSCARDKIKKIFETALVYGDFTLYDTLVLLISDKRRIK